MAALLCGVAVVHSADLVSERRSTAVAAAIPALVFVLAIVASVIRERGIFFAPNRNFACRRIYPYDPFLEAEAVAAYLKGATSPGTRLAIFGSEPEVYFESRLHSATGYIYTYGLMEQQPYALQMREDMLKEVKEAAPEYVLFVDHQGSWGWFSPAWQGDFFQSVLRYVTNEYDRAAEVKIAVDVEHGIGENAAIYVFRRRPQ